MLLTRSSAVNQKIALKTIKKFGFSVNAVWNGKEALDYLLEESTPTHPKPDIILMDVQMPILDGYRATHFIRHHSPYSSIASIRSLPIVAMTASAIQGDKEKCEKAGMDDYLAKPVKGKTLEKMLLKWAAQGKQQSRAKDLYEHTDHDSNCTDHDITLPRHDFTTEDNRPQIVLKKSNDTTTTVKSSHISDSSSQDSLMKRRAMADKNGLPGTETEGDRGLQRAEAEEKATSLRDDKLLAASNSDPYKPQQYTAPIAPTLSPPRPAPPLGALTEENVTRLDRQLETEGGAASHVKPHRFHQHLRQESSDSTDPQISSLAREGSGGSSEELLSTIGSLPPRGPTSRSSRANVSNWMKRHESDRSQVTVTQRNFVESPEGGAIAAPPPPLPLPSDTDGMGSKEAGANEEMGT